jgi:putative transposase
MSSRRIDDSEPHVHFITFSCHHRRNYLEPDHVKRIVIGHLGSRLSLHKGLCLGYVVMPNHVHVMVWFPEPGQLSDFVGKWKDQSARTIQSFYQSKRPEYWRLVEEPDSIWQGGYYDFNIWSRDKVLEKLTYMHENPVRAGLVMRAVDWPWSSARWYADRRPVGLAIQWPLGLDT